MDFTLLLPNDRQGNIDAELLSTAEEYKRYLALADMARQGDLDGRGTLSTKAFISYIKFMLEIALDQVDFMSKNLEMHSLHERIESYVRLSKRRII